MNERILIIEDDAKIRTGLSDNLAFEGFRPVSSWNAETGAKLWIEEKPELVLLDLMLPGKSGFKLLREMRALSFGTPVIIVSARGEEWDKLKGFRLGCDDYMVKPFSIIELIARIKAVLRRFKPEESGADVIKLPELTLDVLNHKLKRNGECINLSERLTAVLSHFMQSPERVITRKELLQKIWRTTPDIETRTVDVHIAALRKKIKGSGFELETVYKAGYRLHRTGFTSEIEDS